MPSRAAASWLLLLVLLLLAAGAADYGIFVYRQQHGDILSFATVRQYQAVPDRNGSYHYEYVGILDVPCVEAFLPHVQRSPCWWVSLHYDHWL